MTSVASAPAACFMFENHIYLPTESARYLLAVPHLKQAFRRRSLHV
jgi:hypothetical protein